jgi:uncharacterized protein YegP (UPF0339 family)
MVTLAAALGVLAAGGLTPADAQDKDAKARKVKGKTKDAVDGGTIEVYKAKDGFRFRIKSGDGRTMAMPARGVETRAEVIKNIEDIKAILNKAQPMDAKN